ncbi:MAG: hypothetical protein AAFQ57_18225 [Cyanobacteria bacterium J06626_14]
MVIVESVDHDLFVLSQCCWLMWAIAQLMAVAQLQPTSWHHAQSGIRYRAKGMESSVSISA